MVLLANSLLPHGAAIYDSQPALHREWKWCLPVQRSTVCTPCSWGAALQEISCQRRHRSWYAAVDQSRRIRVRRRPIDGGLHRWRLLCQLSVWRFGRNTVRGPHFTDSDIYITKTFKLHEGVTFRFDTQMFNAFNHANFALPSNVEAGVPGSMIPARFGTLQSTISPPTGLLGVGLGGDSSPRMIAFQGRIEF